jgi:glycine betaine/proline transport system permease protein
VTMEAPPSSGLGELEREEAVERRDLVYHERPRWRRRAAWAVVVVVVIAIGLQLTAGFPKSLTVDAAKPFNDFVDWVIRNQRTSALFVKVITPVDNFFQSTYDNLVQLLSRMTWLGVVTLAAAIAGVLAGWRMALLAAIGFLSFGVLGFWEASLETLALIMISVAIAVGFGIPLGIWAGRHPFVESALRPVLDAMQTVPAFSYFVPFALLLGIGAPPSIAATVIFAIPPAIRLTSLGIRTVSESSLEVGHSFGATSRQMLRKVQLPLAKPSVMLGVNQSIMMALGIVVLAATIGAGGLGQSVLDALSTLDVGAALAAGLAIVAMAIVFDRVTFAWSRGDRTRRNAGGTRIFGLVLSRRVVLVLAVVAVVAAVFIGRQVLRQQDFPVGLTWSFSDPVNQAEAWVLRTFGGLTDAMTGAMVHYALDPLFKLLTGLPWWMVCGFAALIGWAVSRRWTLPLAAFLLMAAVGVIGMWDPAMNTLSQVLVAVASAVVLAVPLGIWAGKSDRVHAVFKPILDTMQTMPQFVYLVPAVALFGVGRVPGVIAALVYAIPPGIRLTDLGIRQVPKDIVEASDAFGATSMQTLWKVQLPLARPSILLGVNQTVIMVFSVVIIAGLVGGAGLGYLVVQGLSHDPGLGVIAGIAILLMAIVIDRITQALGQASPERRMADRQPSSVMAPSGAEGTSVEEGERSEGEEDG